MELVGWLVGWLAGLLVIKHRAVPSLLPFRSLNIHHSRYPKIRHCMSQNIKNNYNLFQHKSLLIKQIALFYIIDTCFDLQESHHQATVVKYVEDIFYFNTCIVHISLFSTMTNKCKLFDKLSLLHVSTLSCHPQGTCNQYLAKSHKYFKCSCW